MSRFLANVHTRLPLVFDKGKGCYLFSGKDKYLDFTAGIAVNSLGHSNKDIVKVLRKQAKKLVHVSNLFRISQSEELAKSLCDLSFAKCVFFCNSGAEANESAIKIVRKYFSDKGQESRKKIVCFNTSFHGRTMACISATGNQNYINGFTPILEGFHHVDYGDLDALESVMKTDKDIAAVMFEPIQAEGGVRYIGFHYIKKLREICDRYDCLLVADEVQTGYGRTGKLFACEWSGVDPDITSTAKAMGNGFPIGGVLIGEKVKDTLTPGSHGTTYGGSPLATAVGKKVLDIISDAGFLSRVRKVSVLLDEAMQRVSGKFPSVINEVRGYGMLRGFGLVGRVKNSDVYLKAPEEGVLITTCGLNGLRFLPPLIIEEKHVEEFEGKISKVLQKFV